MKIHSFSFRENAFIIKNASVGYSEGAVVFLSACAMYVTYESVMAVKNGFLLCSVV